MSLESSYIQAQVNLLGLHLALAGEIPKRSGDFETTYKTEGGKEVTVKRSPDGKFASQGNSNSSSGNTVVLGVDKVIVKAFAKANDELSTLPEQVQAEVRKLMFDSNFNKGIDKTTKSIIDKIDDPNLTVGFNLGQRINEALAKKPFSEFGQTIADKFAEFKEGLPRKTDDLRKEIGRIARDPNTSVIVATGVLMALAGSFHLAGVVSLWRGGGAALQGIRILPALLGGAIGPTEAIAQQAIATSQALGYVITSGLQNIVAAVIASRAGKIILDQVKVNAQVENDRLKQEILAKTENSDILYQQQLEQQAKDIETRKKLLKELLKNAPKQRAGIDISKPETLAGLPVLDIKLTDSEEAFVKDPKHYKQVLVAAYKDEKFLALAFRYLEALGQSINAAFFDEATESHFDEIMEQTEQEMVDRLTVVIGSEIKRIIEIETKYRIEKEVKRRIETEKSKASE